MPTWHLECSACDTRESGTARASVCPVCGQPFLVRYDSPMPAKSAVTARWDMWRYAPIMPLCDGETPVSLGEGLTPLSEVPKLASEIGVARLWVKDEGLNPTASFKARGMSAAVTRARGLGVPGLVVPTAGNAGAALAAYGAAARIPVRVYAPDSTPKPILDTIRVLGADLHLIQGHIGDAGKQAKAFAAESQYFDMSTLREPYRIEGKKTMGIELAEQLGWNLPTHIIYPTGDYFEMVKTMPAFESIQVKQDATPWENPVTHASGLRVPGPLGDRLILRALRESGGDAHAVSEEAITRATQRLSRESGVDAAPEGGCALAVVEGLVAAGRIPATAEVLVFNTGSGASYRF